MRRHAAFRRHLVRFAARRQKRQRSLQSRLAKAARHPLTLLLLGFFLTGFLGTLLSYWLQDRHWQKQQDYANRENVIKTKHQIMEGTLDSAARVIAANQDVVFSEDWELDQRELERRVQRWHRETTRWQAEEKVLRAKLQANFRNALIHDSFDAISTEIDALTTNVFDMYVHRNDQNDDYEGYFNAVTQIKEIFRGKSGRLNGLASLMVREIEETSNPK
jgi:hypothetical protein